MRIFRFTARDVFRGPLILVNQSHPVQGGEPGHRLVPVRSVTAEILLEKQAARMLSEVTAVLNCGSDIVPVSGYRTMREQRELYENSLKEHGEDFTRNYVALPGCSEHQTGLAVDLAEHGTSIDFIRPDFPYTGVCARFRELSVRYGFIERYPAGRERITRIAHEPWHFRYVGFPHSETMTAENLTLEEYTDCLKQYACHGTHLRLNCRSRNFEIFHVPVPDDGEAVVELPGGMPFQASGNNVDGVVVTLGGLN